MHSPRDNNRFARSPPRGKTTVGSSPCNRARASPYPDRNNNLTPVSASLVGESKGFWTGRRKTAAAHAGCAVAAACLAQRRGVFVPAGSERWATA